MTKKIIRKSRMKESLPSEPLNHSLANFISSLFKTQSSSLKNFAILCLFLVTLLTTTATSEAATVQGTRPNHRNIRNNNDEELSPLLRRIGDSNNGIPYHHFVDQHNEYDSGSSVLDDDTLRLSLAIDDDSSGGGLNLPSLRIIEPKVYLRVSGESGMIRPESQLEERKGYSNEVQQSSESKSSLNNFRLISLRMRNGGRRPDLQIQSSSNQRGFPIHDRDDESTEVENSDDDEMSDNYHHHFPYIESYREKYSRPEPRHFLVTTTESPPPSQTLPVPTSLKKEPSSAFSQKQEWSDIIAQVTTPSSFNEINSSASEHRLADFHIRANLPAYFYNKYSSYSEEDLENVADLDDEHSKYFVKTRPRSITTAGSNIYSNFYYEPPSFSTKSVPIPVKTNKEKVVFVSAKPTQDHLLQQSHSPLFEQEHRRVDDDDDDEMAQQDAPVMTTISSNFTNNVPTMTPPSPQMNYDKEDEGETNYPQYNHHRHLAQDMILKTSASAAAPFSTPTNSKDDSNLYYKIQQNLNIASNKNKNSYSYKSSAETLDVSTSQSILSKVTVNNPHHHLQIVHVRPDFHSKTAASVIVTTPEHHPNHHHYQHTITNDYVDRMTSGIKLGSTSSTASDIVVDTTTTTATSTSSIISSTEQPFLSTDEGISLSTTPTPTLTTTTDATSIPGLPGVDYPTLSEIPQTGFDCQKQRYKGFFADIDTKCQAWHYCDFTDSHSTFLCPNGTLFSQVLLTCDWWFNVDCKQARQLYVLNERLYRYIKPPKPSFPEDFIGEHVDKWLLQQFNNGYLPKVRKKSKAKFVAPPPSTEVADNKEN